MAKILVADDNSNIQKMVGLALKDQGIDVVAVGNGEAAVRKIADVKPDLVLADVFMPVRNGYEVCQFVKQDPALAHIPVILLVGAFDPLDEQEAQRVGADGVLKKPFVPPDPLIAMVKAALTRAGVSLTGEKTEKSGPKKAAEVIVPRPVPLPMSVAPPEPAPMVFEEMASFVEDVPVQQAPPPVEIHGGAPLAFGNLMGTTETSEEDPGFTAPAGMEHNWRAAADNDEEVPEEEEEEPKSSWRRDAGDDEVAAESGSSSGAGRSSWRDLSFNEPAARKSTQEDWDSEAAQPAMTEAASTPSLPSMSFGAPRTEQPSAVAVVANLMASPAPTSVVQAEPLPDLSDNAWKAAISAATSELANGNGAAHAALAEVVSNGVVPAESSATASTEASTRAVEHDAVSQAIDRFAEVKDTAGDSAAPTSSSGSDWELHALKATQLAATWDAPVREAVVASVESVVAEVAAPEAAPQEVPIETVALVEQESAVLSSYAPESLLEEPAPAVAPEPEQQEIPEVVQAAEPTPQTEHEPETSAHVEHVQEAKPEIAPEHAVASTESQRESFVETNAAHSFVQEPVVAKNAASAAAETAPTSTSEADVVARVLASLSPEVMQSITREILKPVVAAMVREELNKKK